jgi:dipeptidyl aminopeptidase/acylaminoacyl peptidase
MMLRRVLLASAIGLLSSAQPFAATAKPAGVMDIAQAAKLFGERPSAFAPDLSPDGDKVVYLAAGPAATTVVHVLDLTSKADNLLVKSTGKPEQLDWCNFADERWVVCRFGGWIKLLGLTMAVARTVAVDTTTGKVRSLGAAENAVEGGFEQFDGEVLDWLPDEQGSLMMQRRYAAQNGNPERIGVDHIRIDPFRANAIEPPMARDFDYMTDGHGAVRLRSEAKSDLDDLFTGESIYEYRRAGSSKWLPLPEGGKDFTPLAIEKQSDSLYFLKPLNGRDALLRIKLDGTASESLVASNPNVDIGSVIEFGPGQPVIGYRYTDDRTHSVYIDPAAKKLGDALAKALPDLPLINFVGSSKNGQKLLIHAGSDVDPGVYFLLDRQTNRMDPVLNSSDAIDGSELAPMKAVSVPTADGKSIPAYVTMRTDLGTGPRAAIVLPHGGPTARDTWQFDWVAQFLAARGYAVIQPNFRGSAGYGKAFLGENAFHDWRQVMSDIRDSADWLVKQGVADPNRVAIVGWSYGGYAALQSAAMDPRYKAVVAIAPVSDLKQLRRDSRGFRNETIEKDEIGKGDQLSDGSPINHAGDIHAPVLMVHGTLDGNVDYDHSKRMLAALKRAGGNADLLTFEGLDHQLDDWDARTRMLTRIGELLDRTIGH